MQKIVQKHRTQLTFAFIDQILLYGKIEVFIDI